MTVVISRDLAPSARSAVFEDGLADLFAGRAGARVLLVPHLYHVGEDDALWSRLAETSGPVVAFSWLHPRPREWLLRRHGVGKEGLTAFTMRAFASPEDCFQAASSASVTGGAKGTRTELSADVAKRWYPVIDCSRCVNCKQCMQFCLFGVYSLDASGAVRVASPDRCKTGCPACSRICPRGAIMFPLYERDEAVAGAPGRFVTPDAGARAMFKKRTGKAHQASEPADRDLDDLIDDLDRLAEGRR
jgi:Pyruvate/2-oxoacid:ferredoxin oxidoreductase delta subunit